MLYLNFMFYWSAVEFLSGLLVSIFAVMGVYALIKHRQDNAPITMWLLNISKTKNQFVILVIANVLLIVSFGPYLIGEEMSNDFLKMVAATIGTVSYGLAGAVIIWWVKGFMRFI